MKQTSKGKAGHFGLKLQIGADPRDMVHAVTPTDAGGPRCESTPARRPPRRGSR